ncbi:ShlB/FhaC/HecB family hemolysin secretion/activation protein [Thiomonas sp. FB-Cd]|uniref:ShlB/FhaC/HecB family hemolysin secretion/activation protein n=1 Tax=Thiomonas sp. FB-Cd TaxID=1158292 RepID=UPI0004DF0BB8|nr:ShlB/FhaC/HecB family hemolysin secretion/activation protein [Thiomonas sp. FB-Cd]
MTLALETFSLPPKAPPVVELRLPAGAAAPLILHSHGFVYRVTGNTLLPEQAVRRALAESQNPQAAVDALNGAYRSAGHLLVAIRAQVQGTQVALTVVQGQITQITAEPGVKRFYDGVEFDPTITQNDLIRRNILAEMYAGRSGLGFRPSVAPAPQPGGSALAIDTQAQPGFKRLSGSLVFGNYGSRYVGGDVASMNLQAQPGDGWLFAANYSHGLPNLQKDSTGSRYDAGAFSASKVTPWGIYGLSVNRSTYRLGVAGAPYYPQGQTQTAALTGTQLVWASPTARLSANQAISHVAYKSTVLGGRYTLADQNYNYATLGLQGARNVQIGGLAGAVSAAASYNLGLSAPRGTMVYDLPSAPQTRFHYWTASLAWQQALPKGFSANLSASGQWGLDTLPGNQQWVVGGYGSVSAFSSSLSGDGGYLLRAVLQAPAWNWRGWQVAAQGYAEQGAATTHYNPANTPGWRMLADVGIGLTFTAPWKTSLSVMAARPVAQKNVSSPVYNSQRAVYFVLQQPF